MAEAVTIETHSEDETRALGAEIGTVAKAGDIVLLLGTFGAGKTTLVQGVGRGLGVEGNVNSPSFTIANEYRGRIPLYHVDLYRVEEMDSTTLEALVEYFGGDGICIVEWPGSLPSSLQRDADRIEMIVTGDTSRRLTLLAGQPALQAIFERHARAARPEPVEGRAEAPDPSPIGMGEVR